MSGPDMQWRVREFRRKMEQVIGETPGLRDEVLCANLIEEEAKETVEAIRRGDFLEAIDGLCDLLFVTFGAAVAFGIDIEPFYLEVCRANMDKAGGPIRASDNKRLKPEGWKPPNHQAILTKYTCRDCGTFDDEDHES